MVAVRSLWCGLSRRILLAACLVGTLVTFFAFGLFTGHFQTFPWSWLRSIARETRELASVQQTPYDAVRHVVTSGLLNFDFVIHNAGRRISGVGGGLAVTDEGVLIAHSQNGGLYFYDNAAQRVHRIKLLLPNNHFEELPNKTHTGRQVDPSWLRYNDVEFLRRSGVLYLLASYTHFHPDKVCFSNRLAIRALENGWSAPAIDNAAGTRDGWQVVFETEPCLPFYFYEPDSKGPTYRFPGHQAGGRIALTVDGFVYLTIGDFKFDGLNKAPIYSQVSDGDYGKIIRIDPSNWSVTKFSLGHRNPQGITVDDEGRIWSVEHGPMGGDELNLVRQGLNYGWPYETLGVKYTEDAADDKSWPLNFTQGRHDKYESPVFAWLPSIAISNIKHIHDLHPRWDGDLLASSLTGQSLHRIRVVRDRVLYEERIPLGGPVRYVDIGKGEIYVLFDDGRFATLRPRLTATLVAERDGTATSGSVTQSGALANNPTR